MAPMIMLREELGTNIYGIKVVMLQDPIPTKFWCFKYIVGTPCIP